MGIFVYGQRHNDPRQEIQRIHKVLLQHVKHDV